MSVRGWVEYTLIGEDKVKELRGHTWMLKARRKAGESRDQDQPS